MIEFFAENWQALLWFLAVLGLLVVEVATVQLVSVWFCLGAVAATIAAVWGASGTVQLRVFFFVSAVALAATPPQDSSFQADAHQCRQYYRDVRPRAGIHR